MFKITEADDSVVRVDHNGAAIVVRTVTTVIEPSEVTWEELEAFVKGAAKFEDGEWIIDDPDGIGYFESYGEDIQDLVAEVAAYWHERGVSIPDSGYGWD